MLKRTTIYSRLLFAFLFFTSLVVLLALASLWHIDRSDAIRRAGDEVSRLLGGTQRLTKVDADFLATDITNPQFYVSRSTILLKKRNRLSDELSGMIDSLRYSGRADMYGIRNELTAFQSMHLTYEETFDQLVQALLQRGFKDHGAEGIMRGFAHELEGYPQVLPLENILMLRRYEKDFLLRGEAEYVYAFNKYASQLLAKMKAVQQTDLAIAALTKYQTAFNELARIRGEIGYVNQGGLVADLNERSNRLSETLYAINEKAVAKEEDLLNTLQLGYWGMIGLCILTGLAFSHILSRVITRPLVALGKTMDRMQERNFDTDHLEIPPSSTSIEVSRLYAAYNDMLNRLNCQVRQIKEKNKVLAGQNNHLLETNHKLHVSENRLKQLNHTKDKFFSIIAHDLKGPMATLSSFLKIFITYEQGFSPEEMKGLAGRMYESTTNLGMLLENLLEWSRSQMGAIHFKPVRLNLYELIRNNIELHRPGAQEKGIILGYDCDKKLDAVADGHMLDFIIRNLLSNAIKFTPGGGKVMIYAQRSDAFVHVTVQDTGIGIPYEDQKRLFLESHHLTKKGTANETGTGLGLLLSKEFADYHQADFNVKSKPGTGTTFRLSIPVAVETAIA